MQERMQVRTVFAVSGYDGKILVRDAAPSGMGLLVVNDVSVKALTIPVTADNIIDRMNGSVYFSEQQGDGTWVMFRCEIPHGAFDLNTIARHIDFAMNGARPLSEPAAQVQNTYRTYVYENGHQVRMMVRAVEDDAVEYRIATYARAKASFVGARVELRSVVDEPSGGPLAVRVAVTGDVNELTPGDAVRSIGNGSGVQILANGTISASDAASAVVVGATARSLATTRPHPVVYLDSESMHDNVLVGPMAVQRVGVRVVGVGYADDSTATFLLDRALPNVAAESTAPYLRARTADGVVLQLRVAVDSGFLVDVQHHDGAVAAGWTAAQYRALQGTTLEVLGAVWSQLSPEIMAPMRTALVHCNIGALGDVGDVMVPGSLRRFLCQLPLTSAKYNSYRIALEGELSHMTHLLAKHTRGMTRLGDLEMTLYDETGQRELNLNGATWDCLLQFTFS